MIESKNTFTGWLYKERYGVILAFFCACIPVFYEVISTWTGDNHEIFNKRNADILYILCNIIFISVALNKLSQSNFLINKDKADKSRRIFNYVKKIFGDNSSLLREGEDNLFKRLESTFRQFFYSWIIVWAIWLILYIEKLLYIIAPSSKELSLVKYENYYGNILNLLNSFAMFFIYMVITISTVPQQNPAHNLKQMTRNIMFLASVVVFFVLYDYHLTFCPEGSIYYYKAEFFIQLAISFIASISMMAIWGRLNSSYLNIPQWMIISLYLYAALQMLYPLDLFGQWMKSCDPKCNSDIDNYWGAVNIIIYTGAFIGKICLFFTLQWIMDKRRFLFFMLHKMRSMAETEGMQNEFDRYYEKYR